MYKYTVADLHLQIANEHGRCKEGRKENYTVVVGSGVAI